MSAHEIQKKICKSCGVEGTRISAGNYISGNSKKWIDENAKQWSGLTCPKCQANRARVNMRILREKRKLETPDNE